MRVLLDTSFALRAASGTGVYVERLAAALSDLGVDVVPVADRGRAAPGGGPLASARNLARDRWWREVALPRHARRARAHVVHHPLPALSPRVAGATPQVITVHDLAFLALPEHFDPRWRRWATVVHRRAARGADAVVAVSGATADELERRWGVGADRVVVAPHGAGQWADGAAPAVRRAPPADDPAGRPYLLYVGDDEPRKDLPTLLAAHRLLREADPAAPDLVLAGRAGAAVADRPDVRRVDGPSPTALAALMDGATLLVHPALHEGVGLTPLEAMARGLPVVAASSAGVRDTCGDAAAYARPGDPRDLAAVLRRTLDDHAGRDRRAAAGRARAATRTWERSARLHVEAYTLALVRSGGVTPAPPRADRRSGADRSGDRPPPGSGA